MVCMTRINESPHTYLATKTAEHPWLTRASALGLAATLAACGVSSGSAPSTAETPRTGTGTAGSPAPGLKLPEPWPAPVELKTPNCSEGASIERQQPHRVGSLLAFYIDGR